MRLLRFALPVGGAVLAMACLVAAIHQIENDAVSRTEIQISPARHIVTAPLPATIPTPERAAAPLVSPASMADVSGKREKGKGKSVHAPATEHQTPNTDAGRNLDTGLSETATQVRRLMKAIDSGRMTLLNGGRDGDQLRELERSGQCVWPLSPEQIAAQKASEEAAHKARHIIPDASESEMTFSADEESHSQVTMEASGIPVYGPSPSVRKATVSVRSGNPSFRKLARVAMTVHASSKARLLKTEDGKPQTDDAIPQLEANADSSDDGAIQKLEAKIQNPVTRPDPAMLRFLTTLAAHASPAHPLEVMSLLRPPYKGNGYVHSGPSNPHSLGMAVDISSYGGHRIVQSDPEACVQTTLAILRDLPPGRYRLGMPKAPEDAHDDLQNLLASLDAVPVAASVAPALASGISRSRLPSRHKAYGFVPTVSVPPCNCGLAGMAAGLVCGNVAPAAPVPSWPFFPAPQTVMDASGAKTVRWRNESYALEADIADERIRRALEAARRRGVNVYALFPDAADHVHVDVR